jgi:GTP-dependent dephospho-CoA kinase
MSVPRKNVRTPKDDYKLTPGLRSKLKKPLGRLFTPSEVQSEEFLGLVAKSPCVVTVGDRITETLEEVGRPPDVFVVDGRERRSTREVPLIAHASTLKAKNPAGGITRGAVASIRKAFLAKKPVMVLIDGEEDLLTIPAVIHAPIGAVVLYGQPLEGAVAVVVDNKAKKSARAFLAQMRD